MVQALSLNSYFIFVMREISSLTDLSIGKGSIEHGASGCDTSISDSRQTKRTTGPMDQQGEEAARNQTRNRVVSNNAACEL